MAFDFNDLSRATLSSLNAYRIYYYETDDTLSAVESDSYFGRHDAVFHVGDIFCVDAIDGKRVYNVDAMGGPFNGSVSLQAIANVSTFPFV